MGKKKNIAPEKVGGWAYFLSYVMLIGLASLNYSLLPALYIDESKESFFNFLVALGTGLAITHFLVRGRLSVLIHEVKHAILSSLHGNKSKGMRVDKDSGEFRYEYQPNRRESNVFIALAPYFLPVFTAFSCLIAFLFFSTEHHTACCVIGIGAGCDLALNLRDISRAQTDLTLVRGGFMLAVIYVLLMNAVILSYVCAWILRGAFGINFLVFGLWQMVTHLVAFYRRGPRSLPTP